MTATIETLFDYKQVVYTSDLKSRALSVLIYLVDRADNKGFTCFPSLATIGAKLHISISTVKRAMKELLEKGFVQREARFVESKNGAQTSNLYTLSVPQNSEPLESVNAVDTDCNNAEETSRTEPQNVLQVTTEVKYISFDMMKREKVTDTPPVQKSEIAEKQTPAPPVQHTTFKKFKCAINQKFRPSFWKKNKGVNPIIFNPVDGGGVHFDTPFNYSD